MCYIFVGGTSPFLVEIKEAEDGGWWAPITWAAFRHEFCEKYYPALARLRNRKAFMQLEQGNRSVEEYEAEFTRLSRFVPLMVATEEEKTDLFI